MTSFTTGGRLRRAAALTLLLGWFIAGQGSAAMAQQNHIDGGYRDYGGYGNEYSYGQGGGYDNEYAPPIDGNWGESCSTCCRQPMLWVGAEYLHWRLDGSELPPLVTDAPATTPIADAGQLDEPTTRILIGDETVNDDWRNGYRIFAGVWLDCCQCWSISGDYFDVGSDDYDREIGPDPDRIVTRPFFNTELGEDDAQLVSVPGELDGTVDVSSEDSFQGAGLSLNKCVWNCCDPCTGRSSAVKVLGGYRYYKYDSDLVITENLTVLPNTTTPLVPGTTIFVQDEFRTCNEFNGAEIGLSGWTKRSRWWFDGMAKFAIGGTRRVVIVDGQTINDVPGGGTAEFEGGLLTSEVTNIGDYDDTEFTVIPEFRIGVGTCVTSNVTVHAGYNLIIWNDVARAASHLPPGLEVDPRNIPPVQAGGGPEPEFPGIRGSELLAHGFDFSIQFTY